MAGFLTFTDEMTLDYMTDIVKNIEGMGVFVDDKHGITTICYNYMADIFGNHGHSPSHIEQIARECRGNVYDNITRKIICRKFHKFFNLNECHETLATNIDWSMFKWVGLKIDGSMVAPARTSLGMIVWSTKKGATPIAKEAGEFASKNGYMEFINFMIDSGLTPIFEWINPNRRIIIEYDKEQLFLLAIRNIETGVYLSPDQQIELASRYNIPCVPFIRLDDEDTIMEYLNGLKNEEGIVIRSDDGQMIKIKTSEYVFRHKSKESITRETDVLQLIIDDRLDDILPYLDVSEKEVLIDYQNRVNNGLVKTVQRYTAIYQDYVARGIDRIQFAKHHTKDCPTDPYYSVAIFMLYAGQDLMEGIKSYIRKKYYNQATIDYVRHLWQGEQWKFSFFGDD